VPGARAAGGSLHARHGRCAGDDFPPPRHPHGVLEADEKAECWAREKVGCRRRTIDGFVSEMIARARRRADRVDEGASLLSSVLCHGNTAADEESTDKFLRDTTVNLLFAGRDGPATGLSWFFYLVSKNPRVEQKLLGELSAAVASSRDGAGYAAGTSGSGMVTVEHTFEPEAGRSAVRTVCACGLDGPRLRRAV
jgi:cytochrome P450